MKNNAIKLSAFALALLLVASPLATFAKEKENRGNGKQEVKLELKADKAELKAEVKASNSKQSKQSEEREEKASTSIKAAKKVKSSDDDREERIASASTTVSNGSSSCIKAFGHLIAPGWIKKNGNVTISGNCWLPFGIGKKFFGGTASTSTTTAPVADTSAPVLSSINSSPRQTDATIKWTTDEKSNSVVFFATSSAALDVNATATPRVSKSGMVKDHTVKIEGLTASTTYYFKVSSKDAAGNVAYSSTMTFVTAAPAAVVTYPVISNVATLIGTSTINVAWKTNEAATSKLYYGTTTVDTNASTTASVSNTSLVTDHTMTISGLSTSTPYFIVIESKNAQGNATYSTSFTVTTNSGL